MEKNPYSILPWVPIVAAAVGAFLGALFAFWVSQINEKIKRNRKRWFKHRDGLIQLQYRLNQILGVVADSRATARKALDSPSTPDNAVVIVWSRPQPLPRVSSLLTMFIRLDLINELFSYDQKLRKLNHDTRMTRQAYEKMIDAFLRENLIRHQYLRSLAEFRTNLERLIKGYDLIDDRTMKLLARTRVALRKDTVYNKSLFFPMPALEDISEDEIAEELNRITNEITEVQSRSRSEIKQYLGDMPPEE